MQQRLTHFNKIEPQDMRHQSHWAWLKIPNIFFNSVARFRLQLSASGPCWLCFRPSSTRRHLPFQLCPPLPLCSGQVIGWEEMDEMGGKPGGNARRWVNVDGSRFAHCTDVVSRFHTIRQRLLRFVTNSLPSLRSKATATATRTTTWTTATTSQFQLLVKNKPKLSCWWRTSKNPQIYVSRVFSRFHFFSFSFFFDFFRFYFAARWQRRHAW